MPILALGVSYRRVPVELLERLSFPEDEDAKTYHLLKEAVGGGVVLSTCNRVEVFAEVPSYQAGFLALKRFLAESRAVDADEIAEPLIAHYESDAVEHLFSVAAGIDSMVVGEPQILAQVRSAFRRAQREGAAGTLVSALFGAAIRTGRRARANTAIETRPSRMVEIGLDMAAEGLDGLSERSALVIGAGEMAALAAAHLGDRGVNRIRVLNRSPRRAAVLAARHGGEAGGLDGLAEALADADVVVSSTAAPGPLIRPSHVEEALALRADRRGSLFLLDLAVPRDVDAGVRALPGVVVADLDDLGRRLAAEGEELGDEVDRVRAIVSEEVRRFESWRRAARLAPVIEALRSYGGRVAAAEIARRRNRLAGLSKGEMDEVDSMARGIVAKLLHRPIVRLRDAGAEGSGDEAAAAIRDLFDLDLPPLD